RVQRLPELQVGRAAVENQQAVAPAADAGAGNEVHVLIGGRRLDRRLARDVERQALAGGVAAVVGRWPARRGRRHGADRLRSLFALLSVATCGNVAAAGSVDRDVR